MTDFDWFHQSNIKGLQWLNINHFGCQLITSILQNVNYLLLKIRDQLIHQVDLHAKEYWTHTQTEQVYKTERLYNYTVCLIMCSGYARHFVLHEISALVTAVSLTGNLSVLRVFVIVVIIMMIKSWNLLTKSSS